MRFLTGILLLSLAARAEAPLPDRQVLRERALQSLKKSEKELEKYSCLVRTQEEELAADGSVKKQKTREEERFFVNGVEVSHLLSRDGKPLSKADAKKEQDRVNYETRKYSDVKNVEKHQAENEREIDMLLKALRFTNERRVLREDRGTIEFDLSGDPSFHPRNIEERFASAMAGRIWIDEESGNIVEMHAQTDRDVKIGGGLIASVHKGFRVGLIQQREPDGVYIAKMAEGSGGARAALFLHPRFRFRQDLDKCHLFSVETQQSVQGPSSSSPTPKP